VPSTASATDSARARASDDAPVADDALPLDVDRPAPPRPRITATGVGLAALGWGLYALLYTFFIARQDPGPPFASLFLGQLTLALICGAYSVPVWWGTVRQMDRTHWGWVLAAHVGIAPGYAWLSVETYLAAMRGLAGPSVAREIAANYQWILYGTLTVYALQFTIYHLVRSVQRLRWREQQAAELAAVARERQLAALKAQINPHFLFNSLNLISATVHTAPEDARNMIAALSDLLRYALRSTDADRVALREEIGFVQAYLDLEAQRFSDRLQVRYDIAVGGDALDVPVPPMVLQPLAENAIKHGIAPREDGGTVTLSVRPVEERLRVCVEDTGAGPDGPVLPNNGLEGAGNGSALSGGSATGGGASAPGGVGLANTTRRLQHAFGDAAALHTEPVSPHGFRVWFDVPRPSDPSDASQ